MTYSKQFMKQTQPTRRQSTQGGFTMMEVVVASSIVGIVFVVTIPLMVQVRAVRNEADRRTIAWHEAANVMEQVAALAQSGGVDPQTLSNLTLSSAADRLPEHALEIGITPDNGPLPGKRITVSVRWRTDIDEEAVPVVLTGWFPDDEEAR